MRVQRLALQRWRAAFGLATRVYASGGRHLRALNKDAQWQT